jgi:hypothetical protein
MGFGMINSLGVEVSGAVTHLATQHLARVTHHLLAVAVDKKKPPEAWTARNQESWTTQQAETADDKRNSVENIPTK